MKTNVYCQDWKLGLFKGTKILGWSIGTKHCSVILPQSQKRSLKSTDLEPNQRKEVAKINVNIKVLRI